MFARLFNNDYVQNAWQHVKDNRATYGLALGGLAKTLLDNYWVFTGLPLGENGESVGVKFCYLLAEVLAIETMALTVGNRLDHPVEPRNHYQQLR